MKKTLHGKRHIRARRIVALTRLKKRQLKFNNAMRVVTRFLKVSDRLISSAFRNATEMINIRIEELKREAQ